MRGQRSGRSCHVFQAREIGIRRVHDLLEREPVGRHLPHPSVAHPGTQHDGRNLHPEAALPDGHDGAHEPCCGRTHPPRRSPSMTPASGAGPAVVEPGDPRAQLAVRAQLLAGASVAYNLIEAVLTISWAGKRTRPHSSASVWTPPWRSPPCWSSSGSSATRCPIARTHRPPPHRGVLLRPGRVRHGRLPDGAGHRAATRHIPPRHRLGRDVAGRDAPAVLGAAPHRPRASLRRCPDRTRAPNAGQRPPRTEPRPARGT